MEFKGIGVALVTPFKEDKSIDYQALGKIIDHVIQNGVDFLVALGTTGETPTLNKEEKIQVLDFIIEHNDKRKPIVLGMGENNTNSLIEALDSFPLDKVDALLSLAPYYNKPTQEGIYEHFKALAEATDKPIILYNVPGRTGVNIFPETAIRLANDFNNIKAIKEASGNIVQCMELVAQAPKDFFVLSGDDDLILAQIAIGMHGAISVIANSHPKEFSHLVNLALVQKNSAAQKILYELLPIIKLIFKEGNPTGVKYVLSEKGLCKNILRLPLVPASKELEKSIKEVLI